jgi:hypothetical protein
MGDFIVTEIVDVPTIVGVTVKLIVPVDEAYEVTVAETPPTFTVILDNVRALKFGLERIKVQVPLAIFCCRTHVPTLTDVGKAYGATVTGPTTT